MMVLKLADLDDAVGVRACVVRACRCVQNNPGDAEGLQARIAGGVVE